MAAHRSVISGVLPPDTAGRTALKERLASKDAEYGAKRCQKMVLLRTCHDFGAVLINAHDMMSCTQTSASTKNFLHPSSPLFHHNPTNRNIKKKNKKDIFRHRESNPGLAGAVSVLLMRAANPSH
jgi:hypothetical protein